MSSPTLSKRTERGRYSLAALLLLVGVNGLAGGYYGMSGAPGVPIEWLKGSPFPDYFIPGLILFIAVGITCITSACLVVMKVSSGFYFGMASGFVLMAWIVVQMLLIGYVSFLQPLMLLIGLLIIFGMRQLHNRDAAD